MIAEWLDFLLEKFLLYTMKEGIERKISLIMDRIEVQDKDSTAKGLS